MKAFPLLFALVGGAGLVFNDHLPAWAHLSRLGVIAKERANAQPAAARQAGADRQGDPGRLVSGKFSPTTFDAPAPSTSFSQNAPAARGPVFYPVYTTVVVNRTQVIQGGGCQSGGTVHAVPSATGLGGTPAASLPRY